MINQITEVNGMKEHIYTIPINDSFRKDCECPICEFLKEEERKLIDYTLGPSMMEPDERIRSNKTGFCNHHFSMLLNHENKLSLALVLETHLSEIRKIMDEDIDTINSRKKSVFKKDDILPKITDKYTQIENSCVICNKLNDITDNFIDNVIFLYKKEDEFKKKFEASKGFCIPHFTLLLSRAKNNLSGKNLSDFYSVLYKIELEHLSRIQEDITWFTKKFDFRFANEDWKTSRDAVIRTTEKISGFITPLKS